MKSKISFFNKTIFLKNVTLYWPLWTVYTITLLIAQPFILWVNYMDMLRFGELTAENKLDYLYSTLYMEPYIWIISIMAIVTGMAVYSYLYNSKSANMIHSLPVDRNQLFGTNVLSGLTFLAVPQVLTFIVTLFICLNYNMPHVEHLAQWLILCFGIDIVAFGIVTFCAFFTGQLITMPIYAIIINCLSFLFYGIVELMVSIFAYGVNSASVVNYELAKWFSPMMKIYSEIGIKGLYNDFGKLTGLQIEGGWYLLIYVAVAIVLFVAAYLVYRKRHIEQAGDLITVSWVKPIFRWGVGTAGAFLCSIYISAVLNGIGIIVPLPVFIIMFLVTGVIFYFVADMFVRKTFRVFKKKNWKYCGIFVIALLVSFGALYGYSKYEENLVPDAEDVAHASISYGYVSKFTGEEVQFVLDMHEEILEDKEVFRNASYMWDTKTIRITYQLKNGDYVSRRYSIPTELYGGDLFDRLIELEMDADNFLRNTVDRNYKEITEFGSGYLSFEDEDYTYVNYELTGEESKKVFDAIIADSEAGVLQVYNLRYYYYKDDYYIDQIIVESTSDKRAELNLNYYVSDEVAEKILSEVERTDGEYTGWYEEVTGSGYSYSIVGNKVQREIYLSFGENCTNIINTLVECGVIESADGIPWEYK